MLTRLAYCTANMQAAPVIQDDTQTFKVSRHTTSVLLGLGDTNFKTAYYYVMGRSSADRVGMTR